jgi:nucleoside-diphosphate-sugar epimerase
MSNEKILVIGACGQIGSVLTSSLREAYGYANVIATDIRGDSMGDPFFINLDVLDTRHLSQIINKFGINQIYHLAAVLSAKGEANPLKTWHFNMTSLFNVLEVSREKGIQKVFFPSSIAVFGKDIPRVMTPQASQLTPSTVYGISKVAGELWCQYYFNRYNLDIRSLRYPGVIGYQSEPGGGTTDYAVEIFHYAVLERPYTCFLKPGTGLPMIYMDDAIRATIELMEAAPERLSIRTSYNIHGTSFTPSDCVEAIRAYYPEFKVDYKPDFRQTIAESWPESIDDAPARNEWGWKAGFDLSKMAHEMIVNLREKHLESVK